MQEQSQHRRQHAASQKPPESTPLHLSRQASPLTSSSQTGPRLARAISSSSRTAARALGIIPQPSQKSDPEPIIKDGNSDEIEESAMNITVMAQTLASGTEDQITLILFETQQVLEVCREHAIQTLVPVICSQMLRWTPSLQISAAEAILAVVASRIPAQLAKTISDTAFQVVRASSDSGVCELWGQILVTNLPHVSWSPKELDDVVGQLETRNESQGGFKRLSMSRHLTARILGSLAMCSKREDLKKRIMYRAMCLTADEDVEVRGMVAESMSFIGASIDISTVEEELWPFISKLVQDENARVHAASMRTLSFIAVAHFVATPRSKLYRNLIPPILIKEWARIRKAAEADQRTVDDDTYLVLEINSEIFGELLSSCWNHLSDDVARKDAFKAFLAMSTCNGPIVRKYCAFNVPGVSKCFLKRHRIEMSSIVEFLSRDTEAETRYVLASGIHQTVKILANQDTINNLFKAVLALLQDESPVVRMCTLRHFEELIAQLSRHMGYNSVGKLEPIFQNLHLLSEGNWRTQELLSKQLLMAAPLVPPPSIRSNVLPLLYKLADQSSFLVRKAAMAAVAVCMRYIPDTTEREQTMSSFRAEWAKGSVYWMRIGFIDSAKAALDSYSRCLFRDTFASELLRLANDPVPNVRVRLALIIPRTAPACHQMMEFTNALQKLKNDDDVDVQDAIESIDDRIAQALQRRKEDFEEDMKREEEEQDLYAKHLLAQKEAFRKKKGNIKRAKTMFLKKSGKGLPLSSSARNSTQTGSERRREKENLSSLRNNNSSATAKAKHPQLNSSEFSPDKAPKYLEKREAAKSWIRPISTVGGARSPQPITLLEEDEQEIQNSANGVKKEASKSWIRSKSGIGSRNSESSRSLGKDAEMKGSPAVEKKEGSRSWIRSKSGISGRVDTPISSVDSPSMAANNSATSPWSARKDIEPVKQQRKLPKKSSSFILRR